MPKRQVLIVAGPGGEAFGPGDIQKLKAAFTKEGADVTVVGDGKNAVTQKQLQSAVAALDPARPTTVVVDAHGETNAQGQHEISLDGTFSTFVNHGPPTNTSDVFKMLADKFKTHPVDVFMTSCEGGAALHDIGVLPKGSGLAVLSPTKESTTSHDIENWEKAVAGNSDLSAKGLLYTYLKGLDNRIAPNYGVSGEGFVNPDSAFRGHIGRLFTDAERLAAHEKLDGMLGADRVKDVMNTMTQAKFESSIYAADYGEALAIGMALKSKLDPAPVEPQEGKLFQRMERLQEPRIAEPEMLIAAPPRRPGK